MRFGLLLHRYGANKQLVGMIAEARDITAKKAAERELVRKNEELQHLFAFDLRARAH